MPMKTDPSTGKMTFVRRHGGLGSDKATETEGSGL